MLGHYRAAFRAPGTAAFSAASFVMRWPYAIYPLALVLIVSARTGHYAFAGALAGIYVAANGAGNPLLARLVDRLGQGRVLLPSSAVHVGAVVVLAVLLQAGAPDWTLVPPVVAAGFNYLSVGSMVRARWSYVLGSRPELSTAYSLESTFDEIVYTAGPLLTTVLATQVHPLSALAAAVLLVVAGAVWLRAQRATEPPPHPHGAPRHPSALRSRGMLLLVLAAVAMGAVFASAEVTMVAFCGQRGERGISGAVVAALAFGSAIGGFGYGSRHWAAPMLDRFRIQAVVFALLPLIFLVAWNVPVLAVCAVIVGLGIAPTLITAFGLIEQAVPAAALTEGLAWLSTGLSVGYGAGSALVGGIADAHGARAAFSVTIASALLVGVAALVLHARLRPVAVESQPAVVG